jgi:chromate transporter
MLKTRGRLAAVSQELSAAETVAPPRPRTLAELMRYFGKLGAWGFGGPVALVGYMRRDLVDERKWFSEGEYEQGLAISQTMPGPLAAQVCMWFGYLERGWLGALAVSLPFVLPAFLITTIAAIVYAHYQGLGVVEDLFFGVAPAVLAIIAVSSYKLARATNKTDPILWAIAAVQALATVLTGQEIIWPFLAAAIFGAVYYGGGLPRLRGAASFVPAPVLAVVNGFAWVGSGTSLAALSLFFLEASAFTFGSGLAIVPFLHAGLVEEHRWLTEQQFVDTVAMGIMTPGPVVIMASFGGYLIYGVLGAVIATIAVFVPVYLFIVVPGRLFRRYEKHPRLLGFTKSATAAAAGAIAGAAIVIGRETVTGWLAGAIALIALALLLQRRVKVPEPAVVAFGAVAGLLLHG